MNKPKRRDALKTMAAGALSVVSAPLLSSFSNKDLLEENHQLKGNVNHSVCQWTYNFLPLDELCLAVKKIGFSAIDLIAPKDWPTLQKYGIYSSMCYIAGKVSLTEGFNDKKIHGQLVKEYLEVIPLIVKAGYK